MMKKWVYDIPLDEVLLYRNLIGCYSINDDTKNIKTKINRFKELSPFTKKQNLPADIKFVEFHARYFIERLNTEFGNNLSDRMEREAYKKAYLGVLGSVINLNLVKDEDYKLLYDRTSTILGLALSGLNNMEIDEVESLYEAIQKEDRELIKEFMGQKTTLSLLLLLALTDADLEDYQIFDETNNVDIDILYRLVRDNEDKKLKQVNKTYKLRPSYKDITTI